MSASASAAPRLQHDPVALDHEPVSPELVLVDPELARRERARLVERARIESLVDTSTLRPQMRPRYVVERADQEKNTRQRKSPVLEWSRTRLLPVALLLSMFANGLLLSQRVTRNAAGPQAAPAVTHSAKAAVEGSSVLRVQPPGQPTTKADLERRILMLVLQSPSRKLSHQLIDSTTGLLKNNVQVVCRHTGNARSFLCIVRAASRPANEGLYVRYRLKANGRSVFKWYGYRSG